jgi:hypothetical protein
VGKPVLVTPAHCKKGKCADNSSLFREKIKKKNGHDNSRPLRKEKKVIETHAHREKEKELVSERNKMPG